MSHDDPIAKSYRDLPEWQMAQAAYLSDEGDPDDALMRRIEAVIRMRDIEREWRASRA